MLPMAHNRVVDGRVRTEAFRIELCWCVHIRTMRQHQFKNLYLVEIYRQVKQRCSINRRPVHSGPSVLCATQFGRINLHTAEPAPA